MPIAATGEVFDALMAAGKPHGIAPVGYRALKSLRLEKGYRAWSSDITPNDTPLHAGLGWAVKMKSNQAFLGREAIEKMAQAPLTKMLAGFTTEREDIVLSGVKPFCAMVLSQAISPAVVMATRSGNRWASAMSEMQMGWMKPISRQAVTSSWWPRKSSRQTYTCNQYMTV